MLEGLKAANACSSASPPPVIPFAWQFYHNGSTLLSTADTVTELLYPYDLGAQGLIIWGSSGNSSSDEPYWSSMLKRDGPMIQAFLAKVNACSEAHCGGPARGRCMPSNSTNCQCYAGWRGRHCNEPDEGAALKSDDFKPVSNTNVFPIFWNVDETEWPLVNVTRFGILPSRLTQTGDACSVGNPGCSGWTQGQLPYITVAGDHVVTRGQHPVNYPMHGGVPQVNARHGHLQTAFFTGLCCSH